MARRTRSLLRGRLVPALALALGLSLTLGACVSGSPATGDAPEQSGEAYSGEVEWWTINLQKNYGPDIQRWIDAYEKEHPDVTIKWVDVPGQDINTKLLAALAGGNVPDAVNITSATTRLFAGSMADLNSLFSKEELADYAPNLAEPLVADGKRVGIPWYNGGTSLGFYNKDLLAKAGFDPAKPPKTYDDALALATAYHKASGKSATNFMAYSNVVQANGIALLSPDKQKAAFNTPETLALVEKFKPLFDSGVIAPGSLGANQRELPQSLENRQIAFNPVAVSSTLLNIEKNSPAVYGSIVVGPPVTGADGKYYMPGQQIFTIPAKSDNQAAAAAWLKYVTAAEQQLALCKLVPIYPSSLKALADPFFTDIAGNSQADQARKVLLDTFKDAVDASLGSGNDDQLRKLFDDQIRAYMSGTTSAKGALDAAEKAWNESLAKGNR
ncbi:carbohydrate ABC transporter substrate-binding protein (CUT1 family) [Kribbella amoyensis]|uniref:Carbohydrate ABC transporter substrate-binding protein (CUT1 family) n=1 Tax=Kribbella amoyensis TaxID=996641 RepID=A0A561BK83_9ACTN|nr:sugar ABC transporter substrate-binding protein [Kribbella amoyensis]TWD79271.1 carbohydrate ABC transporter substrate-binding protein (CUT1 family) [Kribbella amoyensis]